MQTMTNGSQASAPISELQQMTRDYASFARSRAGLGNVLGGIVGVLVFGMIWLFGHGVAVAITAIALTFAWILGRDILRRWLYQPFGVARERWSGKERNTHLAMTGIFTVALLAFAVVIVAGGWLAKPVGWVYLVFCLVTPVIAWRAFFTVPEMVLGFDLLFMCAIVASGHTPDLLGLLAAPAFALAMIPVGLQEHQQFQTLKRRLQMRGGATA